MNTSSGLLGRVLAEEGLQRGYEIHHFGGAFAQKPLMHDHMPGKLREVDIPWFEDLLPALRDAGTRIRPSVVFHAMAVLDYIPESRSVVKVPSGKPWDIRLVPTPKIIDLLNGVFPGSMLIGFKLETCVSEKKLVARAGDLARRTNAELVVANLLEWVDGDSYRCILVDRENRIVEYIEGRKRLSRYLWDFVETFHR